MQQVAKLSRYANTCRNRILIIRNPISLTNALPKTLGRKATTHRMEPLHISTNPRYPSSLKIATFSSSWSFWNHPDCCPKQLKVCIKTWQFLPRPSGSIINSLICLCSNNTTRRYIILPVSMWVRRFLNVTNPIAVTSTWAASLQWTSEDLNGAGLCAFG